MFVLNMPRRSDKTKAYKVISQFHPDETTSLTVLDTDTSYFAKVQPKDLQKYSHDYQQTFRQYCDSFKAFLSLPSDKITANVENDSFVLYQDDVIIFFKINIQKTDFFATAANLIDSFAEQNRQLLLKVETVQNEKQSAVQDCEVFQRKLEEYVEENAANEDKLYTSFVQLLNEKKRRIQLLTDVLTAKSEDNGEALRTNKRKKLEVVSSDEDNEEETSRFEDDVASETSNYEEDVTAGTSNFDVASTSNFDSASKIEVTSTSNIEDEVTVLPRRVRREDGEDTVTVRTVEEPSCQDDREIEEASQVTAVTTATDDTQSLDFTSQELFDRL